MLTHAVYEPSEWRPLWVGGGDVASLRAYQSYHKDAAIYMVTYRDRTVWMTSKQQAIWHYTRQHWHRGSRRTLAEIAEWANCSRASVSRFLRRLDLWRFITLVTIRGHGGGTYIYPRALNEPFQRWTMSARERVRAILAKRVKAQALSRLEVLIAPFRLPKRKRLPYWETAEQLGFGWPEIGSTGATLARHRE